MITKKCLMTVAMLTVMVCTNSSLAQVFPDKPVRLVVPFAAGGGTDILARLLGQKVGAAWGRQTIVENRTGGGSVIGTEVVARSAPDGYTLLFTGSPFTTNAVFLPKPPYDPLVDFEPITMVATTPMIVLVNSSLPVNSIKEFIEYARARSGKMNYSSSGNGGPGHLGMELLKSMAKIDLVHIPYKGAGPAAIDLASGQVQVGLFSQLAVSTYIKGGQMRPLAVTTARRASTLPDLPTVAESGYPKYEVVVWYGILARAGTPSATTSTLNSSFVQALKSPDVGNLLKKDGSDVSASSPAEFTTFLREEMERVRELSKVTTIKLD